jgi:hypothetical protein
MGHGGQGEPDGRRDPKPLTEDHNEMADGLPVLDELEDGSWWGRIHRTTDP